MIMTLEGKVAFITGGADGIGRGLAEEFLQHEAKGVFFVDINEEKGQETEKTLKERYGDDKVQFCKCDVTSKERLEASFEKCMDQFGHLDVVCNNAGIFNEHKRAEVIMAVNLIAVIEGTYLAVKHVGTKNGGKGGVVINTASAAGLIPNPYVSLYCASKHGIVGFTRSVAFEPDVKDNGVRVLAICPWMVDTNMALDFRRDATKYKKEINALLEGNNKPVLSVSEVTSVVLELICDSSANGTANYIEAGKKYRPIPPPSM
ncbi:15-hydroxyprostaglandin dehydrogenase [NAD(+)]-like [Glandiceps talaboti]